MDESAVVCPPALAGPVVLHPFRALHLAADRVGSAAGARAFASPHERVPRRLAGWLREGLAVQEDVPAVWVHEYTARGMTVRGVVGALDLSHPAGPGTTRAVLPHERVLPAQVDELERRMHQMQLQPAAILLAHRASPQLRSLVDRVVAGEPDLEVDDPSGQQHRAWAVTDPDTAAELADRLSGTQALIADGHHRYAAYLRLCAEHGADGPWGRGLAMLIDHDDTPLFLGAIHRLLRGVRAASVVERARAVGLEVRTGSRAQALEALDRQVLVVADQRDAAWIRVPSDRLPVELLHHDLVPALAGAGLPGPGIDHLHTADQALSGADNGVGTAVLLPALELDEVMRVLRTGRLLPEKATSFQPKPSVGVLMRPVHDGVDDRT